MSLKMAEHQPDDEFETYTFSLGWNTDMTQTICHVGHRLPSRVDKPPVPTVLSCSLLGFAVTVKQRFMQNLCLCLPLGWELHLDFGIKYLFAVTFVFEDQLLCIRPRYLATQWYLLTWDMDAVSRETF